MNPRFAGVGKRTKIFSQWLTATTRVQASNERSNSKDDVRKENELLWTELDSLQREHKKLKQVVEQLARDYEESKYFDPLRRYEKMKGMIKRTILHLRLNQDDKGSSCGISGLIQSCRDYAHQVEAGKRREQHQSANMSKQEIAQENESLRTQVKDMRRECSVIRDIINQLDQNYESSKHFSLIQRYRVMKLMIKNVIHDRLVQ
ncbi:uncharacterized protein LOC110451523 [Mizuhopecten yessoensis]|uniref:Uncharacterized protein n=1 Tax=Mizuhopecten yessoensis TaxID=6573 RepID=A0A210QLH3_MIZYE|nr:uncharacterized protein LOC110451523 [Mizuhopecten yessoensis]OWF49580.1 hypothetical protein KP79_PYT06340 [Mizuhopecten yessoensis]